VHFQDLTRYHTNCYRKPGLRQKAAVFRESEDLNCVALHLQSCTLVM
jgi:hypothetical protein